MPAPAPRLAAALATACLATAADAAIIRWAYTARVTDVDTNQNSVLGPGVGVGTSFTGRFWYDDETARAPGNAYPQRAEIEATIGATRYRVLADNTLIWVNAPFIPGDSFKFSADPPTSDVVSSTHDIAFMGIELVDAAGLVFSSNRLPLRMPLSRFQVREWELTGSERGTGFRFSLDGRLTGLRRINTPGDLGLDGRRDIVVRQGADNTVWRMDGSSRLSSAALTGAATRYELRGVGDVDADGDSDVVWWDGDTGQLIFWVMDGEAIADVARVGGPVDTDWRVAEVGDLVGDDAVEVLWRNRVTGATVAWVTDGAERTGILRYQPVALKWVIGGVADFNGDGRGDVLWRDTDTGDLRVWYLAEDGSLADHAAITGAPTVAYQVEGVGDYDGDGTPDVLFFNPSTGELRRGEVTGTALGATEAVETPLGAGFDIGGGAYVAP